jgi:hypothetical protein
MLGGAKQRVSAAGMAEAMWEHAPQVFGDSGRYFVNLECGLLAIDITVNSRTLKLLRWRWWCGLRRERCWRWWGRRRWRKRIGSYEGLTGLKAGAGRKRFLWWRRAVRVHAVVELAFRAACISGVSGSRTPNCVTHQLGRVGLVSNAFFKTEPGAIDRREVVLLNDVVRAKDVAKRAEAMARVRSCSPT